MVSTKAIKFIYFVTIQKQDQCLPKKKKTLLRDFLLIESNAAKCANPLTLV